MDGSACVYSELQTNLNEDAKNSDVVMKPLEEEKEASASESSQSATHPIWLQQLKQHAMDIILIILLSIMLPTWDVFSDLGLTLRLALQGDVYFALSMLAPQLLNIGMTAVLWLRIEPVEYRRWSWILVALQIWPQVYLYDQGYEKTSSLRLGVCWTPSQAVAHWIRKLEGDEGNVGPENQHP